LSDLVALLRMADNPADEMSWFRVLQLVEGVGPTRARRALEALRPPGGGPPELERWPAAAEHIPAAGRELADALVAALATDVGGGPAGLRAERLCEALAPLIRLRYADASIRLIDLEQLVAAARGAEDLRHFVSELVLDPPSSSSDWAGPPHLDEDYLILSTIHSAKGLEWEAVHLISAYDGNIPADMSCGSVEGIAEERRLLYVALTRARRTLTVYVPVRYYHRPGGDAHGYGKASRFLSPGVQGLFEITRTVEAGALVPGGGAPGEGGRRIEVSLDALFG
jgi:DNA helicase-2/ATP-dependent DNA helicase PcrA